MKKKILTIFLSTILAVTPMLSETTWATTSNTTSIENNLENSFSSTIENDIENDATAGIESFKIAKTEESFSEEKDKNDDILKENIPESNTIPSDESTGDINSLDKPTDSDTFSIQENVENDITSSITEDIISTTDNATDEEIEPVHEEEDIIGELSLAGSFTKDEIYLPKDGIYFLDSGLDGDNRIAILGETPKDCLAKGKAVAICDQKDVLGAYWTLYRNADDSYCITNFSSGLVLTAKNSEVVQEMDTGSDTQKWYFYTSTDESGVFLSPKVNSNYRLSLLTNTANPNPKQFVCKLLLTEQEDAVQTWSLKEQSSQTVSLEDGDYYVYPGVSTAKALYVADNSKQEDASLQLYTWLGRRGEWFTVRSLGKGNLYTITNTYSQKALMPRKGAVTYGTPIVQHTPDESLDQVWQLVKKGNGFQLLHVTSGMALGLFGGKFANGTTIMLDVPKNASSQTWHFSPIDTVGVDTQGKDANVSAGYYRLQNVEQPSLVMATTGKRNQTGTKVVLSGTNTEEKATFYIKPLSKGKYAIRSFFNLQYLGMNYDIAENNYKLQTKDSYALPSSQWYIRQSTVNPQQLSIVNVANPALVLSFDGDAIENTRLKITLSTGTKAQRWIATKMVNQRPLTNGERYVLSPQLDTGLVMSVTDTQAGTGKMLLQKAKKQPWEVYIFEYAGFANIYRLRNQWSGKVLAGSTQKDGEALKLVNETNADNQLWYVRSLGNARYRIANVKTGKLLTTKKEIPVSGISVIVQNEENTETQTWVMHKAKNIEKVPTKINIVISPKGTNNVLEVKDASLVDHTPLQFAISANTARQVFQLIPSGNYYKIRSVATGRYVTSDSGNVTLRPNTKDNTQLWKVLPDGIRYDFQNVGNGDYLSSIDGTFIHGSSLVVTKNRMPSRLTYVKISGWQYVSGGLRYYNTDGSYAKNTFLQYNGKLVSVGDNGLVRTGWIKYGAYYYYFNGSSGQVTTDARPYISKLYPTKRAGIWRPQNSGPACEYRITVDRQHPCRVTVYTKYPGKSEWNVPVVSYICSTGADATPTAPGERKTVHHSRWQPLMGPSYGQYGMAILLRDTNGAWFVNGDFFHSLACQQPNDHNLDVGSYNILGMRASHGCVRLNVRNAYWQYNFIPDNTTVYVGDNLARPLNALPQPYANGPVDPTDPAYTGNYGYTENGVYYQVSGFH